MIRHSNSLFISIVIHALIFFLIISSYAYVTTNSSQSLQEEAVCIPLRCYQAREPQKVEIKQEEKKTLIKKSEAKPAVAKKRCICDTPVVKKEIPQPPVDTVKEEVVQEDISKDEKVEEVQEESSIVQTTQALEEAEEITPQPMQVSPEEKYVDEHLDEIVKLLQENLYYPRSARKRGITGTVFVEFTLMSDASVKNIKILSSEKEILSNAAQTTIEELSGKFPKPDETLVLKVPINYSLSQ